MNQSKKRVISVNTSLVCVKSVSFVSGNATLATRFRSQGHGMQAGGCCRATVHPQMFKRVR